jgi:hypothetical protein
MPFARIITSTPALAKDVAHALRSSGYEVEVVSPTNIPSNPVDLEIDLDLQNGIAWKPDEVPVIGKAESSSEYEYDSYAPGEREFILAPMWRNFVSYLRENWERIRPQHTPAQSEAHADALETNQSAAITEVPTEPATPVQPPIPAVIQLPVTPRQQSPSVLAITIAKCQKQFGFLVAAAQSFTSKTSAEFRGRATAQGVRAKARIEQLMSSFASRKHQPVAVTRAANTSDLRPARDLYAVRQLWPIAAGILVAFLLGWTAATYNKLPAQPVTQTVAQPAATVSHASVTLYSQPGAKARAKQQRANAVITAPKPSAVRIANNSTADDEVVVRHYPAKAVTAKNQTTQTSAQGPKHYSDMR